MGRSVPDDGVHFDLDAPCGIQQVGDHDHGGGGTDIGEILAVHATHSFPVLDMGQLQAGADDIVE